MKKTLSFLGFGFMLLISMGMVVGCNDTNLSENTDVTKSQNISTLDLQLTSTLEQQDGKCKINVKTNLPDDTQLIISLSNRDRISKELNIPENPDKMTDEQCSQLLAQSYMGQNSVSIINGKVESSLFSNKGKPLDKGKYVLSVSMSLTKFQPESVQKVLGEDGKNLIGKYVEEDSDMDDKSIHYEQIINIE